MPSTINGIGTHYYGKKNYQTRPGDCPHCGRAGLLASYDTRLWFVVVFVPIIPLGRKHIIDKCPSCSRHYVADADKWETSKQLEVSGAEEKLRGNPTPENAIAVHQQLFNFHQFDEAASFRQRAAAQFPDSAKLQAYFGDALTHHGQLDAALPFYTRALALRSDLPEARAGVAEGHIRGGRLDEARGLLDFLEAPGAAQLYPMAPLERLANAYQKAGRHDVALPLYEKLLADFPSLADNKNYRATMRLSEKALGRKDTVLPKRKFSWRSLFSRNAGTGGSSNGAKLLAVGAGLALIALGFVVSNEYIRRHRTVHLVNGYRQPATVEIAGTGIKAVVSPHATIVLPEGNYHAIITGPVTQEVDFAVRASYGTRWYEDPVWLLNVGGSAVLVRSTVIYKQNPPPASFEIYFGRPFEHFPNVTHPFTVLPESVRLKSNESKTLTDLQFFSGDSSNLFAYFMENKDPARALAVAETVLRVNPANESLLRRYAATAAQIQAGPQADAFLQGGLAVWPLRTAWHRTYQDQHRTPADRPALLARYDALLAKAPENSDALYLRGRIDDNPTAMNAYFARAVKADPRNPYPVFGLAYDYMSAGDWSGARPLLAQAAALEPKDLTYEHSFTIARLAVGEAPAVIQETRDRLKRDPINVILGFRLMDALAARGDAKVEIQQVATTFDQASANKGENAKYGAIAVRQHALYVVGDFPGLLTAVPGSTPDEKLTRAQALIEEGQLAEAEKMLPPPNGDEDLLFESLTLAAAWKQSGHDAEAERWLGHARQVLLADRAELAQAAAWLGNAKPPTVGTARALTMQPHLKALLLVTVMAWHPETRRDFAPLARQLNVERHFPFHFVQHATAPAS